MPVIVNVVFAVVSPLAVPGTYTTAYNHYSFLRTMEDGFGITDHPAYAGTADPAKSTAAANRRFIFVSQARSAGRLGLAP